MLQKDEKKPNGACWMRDGCHALLRESNCIRRNQLLAACQPTRRQQPPLPTSQPQPSPTPSKFPFMARSHDVLITQFASSRQTRFAESVDATLTRLPTSRKHFHHQEPAQEPPLWQSSSHLATLKTLFLIQHQDGFSSRNLSGRHAG